MLDKGYFLFYQTVSQRYTYANFMFVIIGLVNLHRYDEWDNRFFGISDNEAEDVDPQQHFVLESVHMALEDAGIPKETIAGSNTGVYIGE